MNLLTDPWIPVRNAPSAEITLQELLCNDNSALELDFHRDDMELAALQLAICLTQAIFTPADAAELKQRIKTPFSADEYQQACAPFAEYFDLHHPTQPFMQSRGVKAKEPTRAQKIFAGLGANHALFNDAGEIQSAPASWIAIALFNQAVNCPSFGGGFKGGLRGEAPLSTLIKGKSLRETLWLNVLSQDFISTSLPHTAKIESDLPTWVTPIKEKANIPAHTIGLLRGLFWQPAKVELLWDDAGLCTGFNKEKFKYDIEGFWLHPHSPHFLSKKADKQYYASFRSTAPVWTYCNQFLFEKLPEQDGYVPALVVTQYRKLYPNADLQLISGGYRNNQASILQRRHELLALSHGWNNNMQDFKAIIDNALDIKGRLRWALQSFAKADANLPKFKLDDIAEQRFYRDTEDFIHRRLRELEWNEVTAEKQNFFKELSATAKAVFKEVIRPYSGLQDPKLLYAATQCEAKLNGALRKLNPDPEELST